MRKFALAIGGIAPVVLFLLVAQAQPSNAAPAPPANLLAQAQQWCGNCTGTFEGITDPSNGSVYPNGVRYDSGTGGVNCPSFGIPAFTLERYDIWTGSSTITNTSGGSYSGPVCLATFWWPTATATPTPTSTPFTGTRSPTPPAELLAEAIKWCPTCSSGNFLGLAAPDYGLKYDPLDRVCRDFTLPRNIKFDAALKTGQVILGGSGPAVLSEVCGASLRKVHQVLMPLTARAPLPTPTATPTPTPVPTPAQRVVGPPSSPSNTCPANPAELETQVGGAREFWFLDPGSPGTPWLYRGPVTSFLVPWPAVIIWDGGKATGGQLVPNTGGVSHYCPGS